MQQRIKIKRLDWLLIIGAVIAPMTGLRVWKIGPAEVLCFVWVLGNISIKKKIVIDDYTRFFSVFLVSMFFGTIICTFVAPTELSLRNGWATWIYLSTVACVLYTSLLKNDREYNIRVFDIICYFAAIWYLFLYYYSRTVSRSFFGAPLWFHYRFSGGGTNPHQVAVLLCGIAFWFTYQIINKKAILINSVFLCVAVFLERKTLSSTGTAALFLGAAFLIEIYTFTHVRNSRTRYLLMVLEFLITIFVVVLLKGLIYRVLYEWVSEDKNGLGRFYIWASFKNMFMKSPVFGLGPGTHALSGAGNRIEFHNSYLEIYAATGAIGFVAFVVFSFRLCKDYIKGDKYLLPIMITLYGYSMAGFACRRLAYWVILTFSVVIAKQKREIDILKIYNQNHNPCC